MLPNMNIITITTGGCDFIKIYESDQLTLQNILKTCHQIRRNVNNILSLIRTHNPTAVIHLMGLYLPPPAYDIGFKLANYVVQSDL